MILNNKQKFLEIICMEKRTELVSQVESTKVDNIKVRITDIVPIPLFLNSNKATILRITAAAVL